MEQVFIGIDVAKDRLDVHVRPSGEAFAVARDGEGLAQLVERLQALAPALVVSEATGGFEQVVAAAVATVGLPIIVVNPRQIRDFARGYRVVRFWNHDILENPDGVFAAISALMTPFPTSPPAEQGGGRLAERAGGG